MAIAVLQHHAETGILRQAGYGPGVKADIDGLIDNMSAVQLGELRSCVPRDTQYPTVYPVDLQ
jgi:hypothetical protein